jgi:uncharacterized protein (TIGR02271 family)
MTTTQQFVVGVFDNRAQAEQAVGELFRAGFSNDQIRFSGHGPASGGILDTLKSLFTGQGNGRAYDDLVGMGVPSDDASYYQREYEAGRSIVVVLAAARMQEATDILARYGGYGANRRFAQTADYASTASAGAQETEMEGERNLKLREEQLRVQKQPVETGEARLRKDVVTEQKSIDVPVTHEEVYVERRAGSGQPADQPIGEGETYRIPVREEQVTVEKQPVVREEVKMCKRPVQETKQVSETTRREEAHLERTGDIKVQGSDAQEVWDQTDSMNQPNPTNPTNP